MSKICPYCAEEIADDAIKCKHCGEFLNRNVNADLNVEVFDDKNEILGILGLAIPPLSLFFPYPSIVAVLSTSVILSIESSKFKYEHSRRKNNSSEWFAYFILFWIIAYPSYYFKRVYYGYKNYSILSIFVVLIHIVAVLNSLIL